MCGICGIIDTKQTVVPDKRATWVRSMNQALFHRGPDEAGVYDDASASLAMRRLSIIDLRNGQQPVFNETREIGVVFNGEIYNYQALKAEMLAKGHQFRTESDTEVLVHLYETYGTEMLSRLRGMFSFCLFDQRDGSYLLTRDRFGEKPLYYYQHDQCLIFASELSSLLHCPLVPRKFNPAALPYYLRTGLVPEPLTLFKGIESLTPGHYLQWKNGEAKISPYFEVKYSVNRAFSKEEEAIEHIKPILFKAVERQMVSDVPIGAFLSGGIDSSSIVAILQQYSDKKIETFNVRFEEQSFDESPMARAVAKHCGTRHHEVVVANQQFDEQLFWMIIEHVGIPFRDTSAIPTYLISKAISKNVKVALSGDGGDELFGGYEYFDWYSRIRSLQRLPRTLRKFGVQNLAMIQGLPFLKEQSIVRQLARAGRVSLVSSSDLPLALKELFSEEMIAQVTGQTSDFSLLHTKPEWIETSSSLRQIMHYGLVHTLPANMLIKVDRMAMANSLEVRAPFLDPDLFDASAQLPDRLLRRGGAGKYLLRKIMQPYLPDIVFDHPKQGFSIPMHTYQNAAFRRLAKGLLFHENPLKNYFSASLLERVYEEGINHRRDTAHLSVYQATQRLWVLMQLIGWIKHFKVEVD